MASLAPPRPRAYNGAVRPQTGDPAADGRALIDDGLRYEKGGSLDRALAHYDAVLRITDDAALRSEAFVRLSSVHRARCEWSEAIDAARQGAESARAAGLDCAYAEALNAEAIVYQTRGDFEAAVPLLERVTTLTDDERVRGLALQNLGAIAARRGDFADAERRFLESVEHFRRGGYAWGEAVALNNSAAIALDRGRWEAARDIAAEATEAALRVGDTELLGIARLNAAEAAAHLGAREEAERQASASLGHFRTARNPYREAECLRLLGDIALERDDVEIARRCWERALELANGAGATPEAGQLRTRLEALAPVH
jgi:tetratricopeptide (TPR) repeat protein